MNQINETENLAAPGAGLPWLELKIARMKFKSACRIDRAAALDLLELERSNIRNIIETKDGDFAKPILIKRLRGMEDSSRFWSVYMVLEHLRMVNGLVALTIRSLGKGSAPDRVASTADVKPNPATTAAVVPEYEKSCDLIVKCAEPVSNLNTETTFKHPWFGPMDAHQWLVLAGFHMGVHRRQIEKILLGL